MPEQSAETPKVKEAPKKLRKKVNPHEVKGFYYHAAEYQRARQKERNGFLRVVSSVAEPFLLHVRAARLRIEAAKQGGWTKGSTVLDNNTTKKLLEGTLTGQEKKQFRAKSQVHKVFEKYDMSQDSEWAKAMLTRFFNKKGEISAEDMSRYQRDTGLSKEELTNLANAARENSDGYLTADEFKSKFGDEVLLGGLTQDQQQLATDVWKNAWISTVTTSLKYGVAAFIAANPAGWIGVGATTVLGGLSRIASLNKEGSTYDISKQKGLNVTQHVSGWGRLFGVDWDKDHRSLQVVRAAGAGAILGLAAKFLGPHVLDAIHNPGGTLDSAHQAVSNIHGPDVSKFGAGGAAGSAAQHTMENAQPSGIPGQEIINVAQNHAVHFLPDTQPNHDWQQLHSYITQSTDANGHSYNAINLNYVGMDDGGQKHFLDLMMDGNASGRHVFIDNNIVLALNGQHAHDTIHVWDSADHQVGTIQSGNLATQLGLTQDKIDHFATLTAKAHGPHGNDGLWHGTQDASDLQKIMFDRHIYDDGANGDALYGARIGGGYFDSHNTFQIGASNHYYDTNLLNNTVSSSYAPGIPLQVPGEATEQFHSALAPSLNQIDTGEDTVLEWFREHLPYTVGQGLIEGIDAVTDFQLTNLDNFIYLWQVQPGLAALEAAAFLEAGYAFARTRPLASKKAAGVLATVVNPGWAAGMGIGYVIGRLRNGRKAGKKKKPEPEPTPTPTPQPQPVPQPVPVPTPVPPIESGNPTGGGTQQPAPVGQNPTVPTPTAPIVPPPATSEEGLPATGPIEGEPGQTPGETNPVIQASLKEAFAPVDRVVSKQEFGRRYGINTMAGYSVNELAQQIGSVEDPEGLKEELAAAVPTLPRDGIMEEREVERIIDTHLSNAKLASIIDSLVRPYKDKIEQRFGPIPGETSDEKTAYLIERLKNYGDINLSLFIKENLGQLNAVGTLDAASIGDYFQRMPFENADDFLKRVGIAPNGQRGEEMGEALQTLGITTRQQLIERIQNLKLNDSQYREIFNGMRLGWYNALDAERNLAEFIQQQEQAKQAQG